MEILSPGATPSSLMSDAESSTATDVPQEYAITVRHALIQYKDVVGALLSGSAPTVNVVLKDFNMTVQKGHIYGLLGSSGCGKTSILRAMVGQVELTAGSINILGHKPRGAKSGIPGTTVGYMPQDICLIEEFSIKETMSYFGQLGGMTSTEIQVQCDRLVKLLDLPEPSRIVGTLSGGQQRRVSFAIALLYSPPVLILDEPTVGVDPLLRESIWEFLTKLVKTSGATVLITTHYIEEATLADTVGLIRHGKLMAEQNPLDLMRLTHSSSLEDVLLKLCLLQSTREDTSVSTVNEDPDLSMIPKVNDEEVHAEATNLSHRRVAPFSRLKALLRKDAFILIRHYWFTTLILLLGPFETFLYPFAIGRFPEGIRISAYNQEKGCYDNSAFFQSNPYISHNDTLDCALPFSLSCRMLALFENNKITVLNSVSEESAVEDVRRGRSWAALTFGPNFTASLMERAAYSTHVGEKTIDEGAVGIAMDQSDQVVSLFIQDQLIASLKQVMAEVDDVCHNLKHVKDLPIRYYPPIYGYEGLTFGEFGLPGLLNSFGLMMPWTLVVSLLLPERTRGTLERALVVGTTMGEVVLALFISCVIPVVLLVVGVIVVPYGILGLTFNGDFFSAFILMYSLAIPGMVFGFIIALLCDSLMFAYFIGFGFYFTCFFASGSVWPVEGAHPYLQWLFRIAPMTMPTEALRHIVTRGWSLANWTPLIAIAVNATWTIFFVVLLLITLRFR